MGRGRPRKKEGKSDQQYSILLSDDADARLNSLCKAWGKGRQELSRSEVIRRLIMEQNYETPELIEAQLSEIEAKKLILKVELANAQKKTEELVAKRKVLLQTKLAKDYDSKTQLEDAEKEREDAFERLVIKFTRLMKPVDTSVSELASYIKCKTSFKEQRNKYGFDAMEIASAVKERVSA